MKKIYDPVLFFGSGPVAAKSLETLTKNFTIEAVITKPAPIHHHSEVPVMSVARHHNLTTHAVSDKQKLTELFAVHEFSSKVGILVDFGIILPRSVIDYFPFGIVNSHFSLLPEWRGADPITFAVLSGQKETGVSLMLIVEAMDEGPLLAQSRYKLPRDVTTPNLTEALTKLSNTELAKSIPLYLEGKLQPFSQDPSTVPTYSRKLSKDDSHIDWRKPAIKLEREVRAYIEWPKSHAKINGIPIVITKAHVHPGSGPSGKAVAHEKTIQVFCGEQSLIIDRLKPVGKKEMSGREFLVGHPLANT